MYSDVVIISIMIRASCFPTNFRRVEGQLWQDHATCRLQASAKSTWDQSFTDIFHLDIDEDYQTTMHIQYQSVELCIHISYHR